MEPIQSSQKDEVNDPYLRSGIPFASQNIFQALEGDASLNGTTPFLPASRLSHIPASSQSSRSGALPLKVVSRRATRAYVALSARFRYQRPRGSSQDSSALASLELEVPAYAQYALDITSVDVDFPSGQIALINPSSILAIPKRCQPRDSIIILYNLSPDQTYTSKSAQPAADLVRPVNLSIIARVLVSAVCSPTISLRWLTTVDFSPTQTGNVGRPQGSTRNQNNRQSAEQTLATKVSVDSQILRMADYSISATLSAIDDVMVGEPFYWDIFLVNRSATTRSLSVVVITQSGALALPSAQRPISRQKDGSYDAAPVHIDESTLFDLTKNMQLEPTGLVCLSTNLDVEYVFHFLLLYTRCSLTPSAYPFSSHDIRSVSRSH